MIEIKFKAWNYNEKTMHHIVTGIEWLEQGVFVLADGVRGQFGPVILLQYTGLHDRNGKEIYEGDICKMGWEGHEIIAPMIWNSEKAQFGLDATVDFESPEHIKDVPTRPEVIGNIYENPELLK